MKKSLELIKETLFTIFVKKPSLFFTKNSDKTKKHNAEIATWRQLQDGSGEGSEKSMPVGRAVCVLLALHAVAVAALMAHSKWIKDNPSEFTKNDAKQKTEQKKELQQSNKNTSTQASQTEQQAAQNLDYFNHDPSQTAAEQLVKVPKKEKVIAPPVKNINKVDEDEPVLLKSNRRKKTEPSSVKTWKNYTVKRGDTLSKISRNHKVTVRELRQWNNLKNSTIHPNQKLKIKN